jgi:IgGFc binding protein
VDPVTLAPNQKGDPAQSLATAVEQFRTKYIFLAPDDYDVSYVDIVGPAGTVLNLDGSAVNVPETPLSSNYAVYRAPLGPGVQGAHVLTSDQPVGIQVVGYGSYTSYQYPGGLNLTLIAPPPQPIP